MSDTRHHGWNGRENSEILALRALGFIAARPSTFKLFLAETGLTRKEFRRRPTNREYRVAALRFLACDGLLLSNFSQAVAWLPDAISTASRRIAAIPPARRANTAARRRARQ